MATTRNITNIPAPRVPFIDERTGLMSREWYRFFLNLFVLTGSGTNPTTLDELQIGPPNQPDLTELLIQINQNIAPQYEDQSGDFLATLDTAQLMSMMARFENAEAAIQGAYLQPVVQTGTIANYNLDSSPTAGGVVYGTGPALAVSVAGTLGQVLKSNAAGAPTWVTDSGGTVTSVTGTAPVVSSGGATPAISMAAATTSVNGYLTSTDWTTFNSKQAALVSGTNIKTVNGTTLLGSGDLGTITYAYGGTGLTSYTAGDIIYASAANTVAKLAIGTSGQRLVVAGGLPSWATDTTVGTVTSVAQSFTGGLISVAGSPITTSGTLALTVAGTSGGVPYFSSASTWATSAALAASALVIGGGAGAAPATTTTGTGVVTALGVNTGTAGAFVVNGGALGTPSSGTVTNLTGTASININGTVGATTATTGAFTTVTSSDTTDSSSITTGAITIAGGLGVAKKIYVGDNVVIANGKGIDFSATSGTGTSELFADYEEGDWTPIDSSGAGLVFTSVDGKYTKTGNIVTARCTFTFPATANAAGILIGGLPFTLSSNQADRQGFLSYNSYNGGADTVLPGASATTFQFRAATGAARTNVEYSSAVIYATCIYGV